LAIAELCEVGRTALGLWVSIGTFADTVAIDVGGCIDRDVTGGATRHPDRPAFTHCK
jgi:hypothetical protein